MLKILEAARQYKELSQARTHCSYDHKEWLLIVRALHFFGFHPTFVNWIYQGLSSVSYSILQNGSPHGFFKPSCGLRQGDPISRLLFILGSEVFSRMITNAKNQDCFHGIRIGRGVPAIYHLLYADDLLIFCKADTDEAQVISECLTHYGSWSGQRLNVRKSSITFSRSTIAGTSQAICEMLHLPRKDHVEKHLGLPISIGRNKNIKSKVICERVKHRLESWQMCTLSQAGRLVLIRSVASALLAYTMAKFLLPKTLYNRLDAMMMQFWWGFRDDSQRHLYLKSWASMCQPKARGGLEINLMRDLSRAELTKLAWNIQLAPNKLWVQVWAKYLYSKFVCEGQPKPGSSWFWRGISQVASFLPVGAGFQIRTGDSTNLWSDL